MRVILFALFIAFYSLTTEASAPTNCPIGTWVAVVNDNNKSPKQDIVKALEVLNRANAALKIANKEVESDGTILYRLERNTNNPQNSYGRTLELRTINSIYGSFLTLQGMDFYCWNN